MPLKWDRKKQALIIAYKNVFNSPEGKLVLEDLRKKAPILTNGISPNTDMNTLLLLEGQGNVLKHIYKMLGRDPNEEQADRAKNEPMNI